MRCANSPSARQAELLHLRRDLRRGGDHRRLHRPQRRAGRRFRDRRRARLPAVLPLPAVAKGLADVAASARCSRHEEQESRAAQLARRGRALLRQLPRQSRPARAHPQPGDARGAGARWRATLLFTPAGHPLRLLRHRAGAERHGGRARRAGPVGRMNRCARRCGASPAPSTPRRRPSAPCRPSSRCAGASRRSASAGSISARSAATAPISAIPWAPAGLVAFSRILADREVLVVANTGTQGFAGAVLLDRDINAAPRPMRLAYSNLGYRHCDAAAGPGGALLRAGAGGGAGPGRRAGCRAGAGRGAVFVPG